MIFFNTPSLCYFLQFAADVTPSLPVMKPEVIQPLFSARLDVFDPISGHPTNTELTRIREELTIILLPFPYDVEKVIHNILGLVVDKEDF